MGANMKYSKILEIQPVKYRLEIQYTSTGPDRIHPSRMINANGRIPIIFDNESTDLDQLLQIVEKMKKVYPIEKGWKYVITKIETTVTPI